MSIPKVSIVVPIFNKENYLIECMESLVNQTFNDIEIICVDDGSTDNSFAILEKYAIEDSRIKLIHQTNQGVSAARNNGIKQVSGEYILFVDPDDYIKKNSIEDLYNTSKERDCDILMYGQYVFSKFFCNKNAEFKFISDKLKNKCLRFIDCYSVFFNTSLTCWGKLYKTSLIKDNCILFPIGISCCEDMYFVIKTFIHAKNISVLDKYLYYYRQDTNNSLTKKGVTSLQNAVKVSLLIKNIIYSSECLKNKNEIYKAFLYKGQEGMLYFWHSLHDLREKHYGYKYLKLFMQEYKPFLKDKDFKTPKYNELKKEIRDYKYLLLKKLVEPIFEFEMRKKRKVIYLFGRQVLNFKSKDRETKMDFKEYFEKYSAQKKINKLAKKYKSRKIILYGAGQYANTLFQNYNLSKLNIVAICDKKFEDETKRNFYNYRCIAPDELIEFDCNLILISNFDYKKFADIIDELLYDTDKASIEVRPLIRLNFADLFMKTLRG